MSFCALDLFLFFVFWGVDAHPNVPADWSLGRQTSDIRDGKIRPIHDGRQRVDACRDLCISIFRTTTVSTSMTLYDKAGTLPHQRLLFLAFFIAFAIKVPTISVSHVASRRAR